MTKICRACHALVTLAALSFLPNAVRTLGDAAPASSAKIAVPDAAAQRAARKQINDTFAKDIVKAKKPAEKAAIAKQLLQAGKESRNDPAGKYEMLTMARDLAVAGGDADTALAAITELDQYAIDALKLKTDALAIILKSTANAQDALSIAANVGPLVDEALAADRYNVARQLAELTVSTARTAKDAEALAQANARLVQVNEVESASGPAAKAAGILSTKPNDPAASLAVGRFEAFIKRHWEKGLPLLAAGSDTTLKTLAAAELVAPKEADKQIDLADGWYNVSDREKGLTQAHLREHAAQWYKTALPNLSGLAKLRAEKRLMERPVAQLARTGWVDLLKLVKPDRDAVSGKWKLENGQLTVAAGGDPPKLKIAIKPDGAYELKVEYRRPDGGGNIFAVYLPVGDSSVAVFVRPQQIGLDIVDDKRSEANQTTKAGDFGGDKNKHLLGIAVWPGQQEARVIVIFDGKQQIDWNGSPSRLRVDAGWGLPAPMSLGFGSYFTPIAISGFGMRENPEAPPPLPTKK